MSVTARWVNAAVVGIGLCVLSACATRKAAVLPNTQAPIRRLAVQPFDGKGSAEVTREFTQALTKAGWALAEKNQSADAVLSGSINDYTGGQKLIIFLGDTNTLTNGKTATVSNPVVTGNGSQVLPQGPTAGVNSPHLVTERSVVSVAARLTAMPKGNIVWGDDFSYESLDLARARQAVIFALVRSLGNAAPHLQHDIPVKK